MGFLEKFHDILLSKLNEIFDIWAPNLHQKVKCLNRSTELTGKRFYSKAKKENYGALVLLIKHLKSLKTFTN